MNTLLDPLKRIARDLVEKKLWPVAALLLAAIVAVPLVLGGASPEHVAAPPAVPAGAAAATGSKPLVTVGGEAVSARHTRPGRIKDPFFDPPDPPAAEAPAAAGPAGAPAASASGPAASAPGPASSARGSTGGAAPAPGPAAPSPRTVPQQPTGPAASSAYHRTVMRWYRGDGGKARSFARLKPLGGSEHPAALYLGVTRFSARYAVFLLAPEAVSDGDVVCEEDRDCRILALRAGQSQTITVRSPAGSAPRRYHLEVVSVKTVSTDPATARTMRAKVHADGREVMRAMWQHRPTAEALGPIRYDQSSGLLVSRAKSPLSTALARAPQ